jgi:hypothetical protein
MSEEEYCTAFSRQQAQLLGTLLQRHTAVMHAAVGAEQAAATDQGCSYSSCD